MNGFNNSKSFDIVSNKNAEESETRNEAANIVYFDSQYLNSKNIHNKRKEWR